MAATDSVTAALIGAAKALHGAARAHKRSEAHHRRDARAAMRQLDELRRELASRGIELELTTDTDPEGGPQS
jgi:hypothetical protein